MEPCQINPSQNKSNSESESELNSKRRKRKLVVSLRLVYVTDLLTTNVISYEYYNSIFIEFFRFKLPILVLTFSISYQVDSYQINLSQDKSNEFPEAKGRKLAL